MGKKQCAVNHLRRAGKKKKEKEKERENKMLDASELFNGELSFRRGDG